MKKAQTLLADPKSDETAAEAALRAAEIEFRKVKNNPSVAELVAGFDARMEQVR